MFGKLLAIAMDADARMNKPIDIDKLMTFPLSIVPLTLCHFDGSINETAKSALLNILENKVNSDIPKKRDVLIIDGFFYLRTLSDLPSNYGDIAKQLLLHIADTDAQYIHLIFDTYPPPSMKDYINIKNEGQYLISVLKLVGICKEDHRIFLKL